MTLFQWSLEVVSSDVAVETGLLNVCMSPPAMSCTLCITFFWGLMSQMIWIYVTLATWGTSCLWMGGGVFVPCIYPSPWKSCPISLDMPFLRFILSGILGNFPFWGRWQRSPSLFVRLCCQLLGQSLFIPLPLGARGVLPCWVRSLESWWLPHGLPWGLVHEDDFPGCYTCVLVVPCGFPLICGVLWGAFILYQWVWCGVRVKVIVSVCVLVGMVCRLVVPTSEVT